MNSFVYPLGYWGKMNFICNPRILSVALELDANIATFVYYGKTRLVNLGNTLITLCRFSMHTLI